MAEQRQFAIEIKTPDRTRRLWSGSGYLTLNGDTYEGTFARFSDGTLGSAISLEAPENIAGEVGNRCRFSIAVAEETARNAFAVDVGVIDCNIYWITNRTTSTPGVSEVKYEQDFQDLTIFGGADTLKETLFTGTIGSNTESQNQWNTREVGSTPSGSTGPGSNNLRRYMYYEASFGGYQNSPAKSLLEIDGGTNSTAAVQSWLNSNNPRKVIADVSLQGSVYNDGAANRNGLWLWSSVNNPNFSTSETVREQEVRTLYSTKADGWNFGNNYAVGQTINDYRGVDFLSQYAGGWRRVEFDVPVGARYVGLALDIDQIPSGSSNFHGDAAITNVILEESTPTVTSNWFISDQFSGQLSAPVLDPNALTYSADIEGEFGRFGKGRVRHWSDVAQQAFTKNRALGPDLALQDAEQIRKGEVRFIW